MSPISAPAKVLVTGANGFVATWLVKTLLEKGYTVRGTIRSESKGAHLRKIFKAYGDKLELVIVPDITQEGAFDEAVKGVDVVEHTASPFHAKATDPDDMIKPAVSGTVGVLESIKKYGTSVKRVIVTSSVAAMVNPFNTERVVTLDENSWDEPAITFVKEHGKNSPPALWYLASKTLAEKAAWKFVEDNKGSISFDLVVLNPPYVFGPSLLEVHSAADLNESLEELYSTVIKGNPHFIPEVPHGFIDVRDLAEAHVRAAEKAAAGGKRLIVSGGSYHWQDLTDIAVSLNIIEGIPKGNPGAGKPISAGLTLKSENTKEILGMQFRPLEEVIRDVLTDLKQKGVA
ncbi:D-lactaldehyde dehydrogenase [Dentipellis sp. KUC8613]|nr:D-lactaldehyde dehydrogenase [Dentipellis sp. KUC8613]